MRSKSGRSFTDDEPAAYAWLPRLAEALGAPVDARTTGRAGRGCGAANDRAHYLGWHPLHRTWRTGFHNQ